MSPLSGHQYELTAGDYTATVASVGASLRRLTFRGRDLVLPFDADELRPLFRGATLAPWPNRVTDGRYVFDGAEQQLALTEPARGHALHGLVAWQDFAATELTDDRLTLVTHLPAQQGYPHPVSVEVTFVLDGQGLTTAVTGTNLGAQDAPWGTGPHPYLVAGPGRVDDWILTLPADRVLTVTPDRLIPTGLIPVEQTGSTDAPPSTGLGRPFETPDGLVPRQSGSSGHVRGARPEEAGAPAEPGARTRPEEAGAPAEAVSKGMSPGSLDFRAGRVIGDTFIDHAFTQLARGADGLARVEVRAAATGVAMIFGAECSWVQVHTADLDDPSTSRRGLAVEPMTCAPDAYNSHPFNRADGLIRLEPGQSHTASWTITALD